MLPNTAALEPKQQRTRASTDAARVAFDTDKINAKIDARALVTFDIPESGRKSA
jgi:hypothetical protein